MNNKILELLYAAQEQRDSCAFCGAGAAHSAGHYGKKNVCGFETVAFSNHGVPRTRLAPSSGPPKPLSNHSVIIPHILISALMSDAH